MHLFRIPQCSIQNRNAEQKCVPAHQLSLMALAIYNDKWVLVIHIYIYIIYIYLYKEYFYVSLKQWGMERATYLNTGKTSTCHLKSVSTFFFSLACKILLIPSQGMMNNAIEFSIFQSNSVSKGLRVSCGQSPWLALVKWLGQFDDCILTHWGRVTHICISRLTITGSDNGLLPRLRQAIIWTSAGILLIGPLGTNFSEILIEIHSFSFKKMHLKMSSGRWRPFCLGLNVLTHWHLGQSVSPTLKRISQKDLPIWQVTESPCMVSWWCWPNFSMSHRTDVDKIWSFLHAKKKKKKKKRKHVKAEGPMIKCPDWEIWTKF